MKAFNIKRNFLSFHPLNVKLILGKQTCLMLICRGEKREYIKAKRLVPRVIAGTDAGGGGRIFDGFRPPHSKGGSCLHG
jgi:hypothetical protein